MTKQEKIKKEWIALFGEKKYNQIKYAINENGYINCINNPEISNVIDTNKKGVYWGTTLYIPFSLRSMETNNGWNVLKGLKNEIEHDGDIWILNKNGNIEIWLESQFLPLGYATHWMPIIKPKPPIY